MPIFKVWFLLTCLAFLFSAFFPPCSTSYGREDLKGKMCWFSVMSVQNKEENCCIRLTLITLHWILILFDASLSGNPHHLSVSLPMLFILQKRTGNFSLVLLTACRPIINLEEIFLLFSVLVSDTRAPLAAVKRMCRQTRLVSSLVLGFFVRTGCVHAGCNKPTWVWSIPSTDGFWIINTPNLNITHLKIS